MGDMITYGLYFAAAVVAVLIFVELYDYHRTKRKQHYADSTPGQG
jgi:hypothetical protein